VKLPRGCKCSGKASVVVGGYWAAQARPSAPLPASMSRFTFQSLSEISATFALESQET
jgi:hypothetical protein